MYRFDPDLIFLGSLSSMELKLLVDILIYDENKEKRYSETLSTCDEYKNYGEQYEKYWQRIAEELQYYGGDSMVNMFRGTGVLYKEILNDAVECVDSTIDINRSVEEIEGEYLSVILHKAFNSFSEEQRSEFINSVYKDLSEKRMKENVQDILNKLKEGSNIALDFLLDVIKNTSEKTSKAIAAIIATVIVRYIMGIVTTEMAKGGVATGLTLGIAANAATRGAVVTGITTKAPTVTLGGPLIIAIGILSAVPLITGKALRVTIPACVIVSLLRMSHPELQKK